MPDSLLSNGEAVLVVIRELLAVVAHTVFVAVGELLAVVGSANVAVHTVFVAAHTLCGVGAGLLAGVQ